MPDDEVGEAAAQLAELKKRRQTLRSSLTRSLNTCNNPDAKLEDIRVRATKADEIYNEFEVIQGKIEAATAESQLHLEDKYREEIENKYFAIKALVASADSECGSQQTAHTEGTQSSDLTTVMQSLVTHQATMSALIESMANNQIAHTPPPSSGHPSGGGSQQQPSRHELRLPTIQIPEFDGKALEWIRFRDLFESMIHSRSNISDAEKLEYLHTKLKGDALSLIKHLKPTNDNFSIAWELLNTKFNNSEKIKYAYLTLLLEQHPLKLGSVSELVNFYNRINESYNALKVLDEPVQHWDSVLVFTLEKKLDTETSSLWFREKRQDEPTTFKQFLQFLDKRIYEIDRDPDNSKLKPQAVAFKNTKQVRNQARTYTAIERSCPVCNQHHELYNCGMFKAMSIREKQDLLKTNKLCFNCLQPNHMFKNCAASSCKICGERHNTLLHATSRWSPKEPQKPKETTTNGDKPTHAENQQVVHTSTIPKQRAYILLPTAIIMIIDKHGVPQQCRALLDSGSQTTLITEACVQRLNLERSYDRTILYGINNSTGAPTRGKVIIEIMSKLGGNAITTEALCLSTLTQNLPSQEIEDYKLRFFDHLMLADKSYNKPGKIDVILGADIFSDCCLPQKLAHPTGAPVAMNTIFGWVLLGRITTSVENPVISCHSSQLCPNQLDEQLQRFWEVEEILATSAQLTEEEEEAERHYVANTSRNEAGRYVVRLPLKHEVLDIGESRSCALKRLHAMERRFKRQPEVHHEYMQFMDQYIELGHMEVAPSHTEGTTCFLPHHAVFKLSSTTTKVRVVFDASCQTSNGKSLNDNLMVGPKQQNDLFDIIIKFRKYEIGFIGDIEKMYRQILIHPEQRQLQRILWRRSENDPVQEYNLNTVTYGTSAAPFLATRTLNETATVARESYPLAANTIREQFYVDDLMACTPTVDDATRLKTDICKVLSESGLYLRKWASNSCTFLERIPGSEREQTNEAVIDQSSTVKTLGLLWNTSEDVFRYSVMLPAVNQPVTKRLVLSDIARIYDPLGWLSPVIVRLKIYMQKLWLKGVTWDDPLPKELCDQWADYRGSIESIKTLKIPRWLQYSDECTIQLHGYSDASELAYAAAVYLKIQLPNGDCKVNLIAAKTRVSPVKQISLPRLELCAAHLLVKLVRKVHKALDLSRVDTYGWSDSTIVLAWISEHPRKWKSFVANRTSKIIDVIPARQWRHVKSQWNPADLATRGIWPNELISNKLWWNGPSDLLTLQAEPRTFPTIPEGVDMEERKEQLIHHSSSIGNHFMHRFSSFDHLMRVTGWIMRFMNNCRSKQNKVPLLTGFLTTKELSNAHLILVRQAQYETHKTELQTLMKGQALSKTHKLSAVAPFVDECGIIRVGGRLANANISYDQKHPIVLHKDHHLTQTIIRQYHIKHMHAGTRLLQYTLGLKYWISGASYAIKKCVYKCPTCMRQRAQPYEQKMGNLPRHRLEVGAVFLNVGIDYAGPVQVRSWKGRGAKTYKAWLAIFVCLVTKALHIELVSDLTTTAFIGALRRFVARRGRPSHIYTDNGTNFVGANNHFSDLFSFLKDRSTQQEIINELSSQEIQWHFSPPAAPHFGGIWEAGVKSIKHHLRRVLGESLRTYEELVTMLCQVEACLNSRPLCIKHVGDTDPLTPAHFLILRPMAAVIDEDYTKTPENRLSRWNYVQRLVQQFWKKWSLEYMHQLEQRSKWSDQSANLNLEDVVLIKDDNLPPSQWNLGKVIKLHKGSDGLVRVVTLKTAKGEVTRPIVKLCPLRVDS